MWFGDFDYNCPGTTARGATKNPYRRFGFSIDTSMESTQSPRAYSGLFRQITVQDMSVISIAPHPTWNTRPSMIRLYQTHICTSERCESCWFNRIVFKVSHRNICLGLPHEPLVEFSERKGHNCHNFS